ncbi:MAG: hypothetical protein ACI8UP_004503 [Porticoccaceae bacterium]|jgi:hypothetical protein
MQGHNLHLTFPSQHPITLYQQLDFDGLLALRAEHKTTPSEGKTVPRKGEMGRGTESIMT